MSWAEHYALHIGLNSLDSRRRPAASNVIARAAAVRPIRQVFALARFFSCSTLIRPSTPDRLISEAKESR